MPFNTILKETLKALKGALLGWGDFEGPGQKGCKEAKGIKTERERERSTRRTREGC